ncbi:MAG: 4'-phosphopantetheinyl transferase superfamily protein [Vicinamibacteria bacterium]|jgi:phosphopantetheinyl transferase|nr:4'-phosphopantetheinyl transferase superfamily protein [Vicinamibacteria bacterium]
MTSVIWTSARRADGVHATLLSQLLSHCPLRAAFPLRLTYDPLGRPVLLRGDSDRESELAVSFAHEERRSWAALSWNGRVGIDVAGAHDFRAPYPYGRVFTDRELEPVISLCSGDRPLAAALIWCVKEAAVKALGCGFHGLDYREVETADPRQRADSIAWRITGRPTLRVRSQREGRDWLALACDDEGNL